MGVDGRKPQKRAHRTGREDVVTSGLFVKKTLLVCRLEMVTSLSSTVCSFDLTPVEQCAARETLVLTCLGVRQMQNTSTDCTSESYRP